MRLDIGWRDLIAAAFYAVLPGSRHQAAWRATCQWVGSGAGVNDTIITLSVRSAFDLTLRALRLPPGSEVLMTALTIPDMVKIVHAHGLVPVPVDTDAWGNISCAALRKVITRRSRILVVAHLYGGRVDLNDCMDELADRGILLFEDCAQSFTELGDRGHASGDVVMHSFGPIKTATALGGAVMCVKDPQLCTDIKRLAALDPLQTRSRFLRRVLRFATLRALQGRWAARCLFAGLAILGIDVDGLINSLGRGFDGEHLLHQIRKQPSTPLLRLLRRRWRSYRFSRIQRRSQLGKQLDHLLGIQRNGAHAHWVYPIFVQRPLLLRRELLKQGFDATTQSRMSIVPATSDGRRAVLATHTWEHKLFLPWYAELPAAAIDQLAAVIQTHQATHPSDPHAEAPASLDSHSAEEVRST